jgi:hypothetical protein
VGAGNQAGCSSYQEGLLMRPEKSWRILLALGSFYIKGPGVIKPDDVLHTILSSGVVLIN